MINKTELFAFLCQLDDVIDLVIPRGSNRLVSQIKESTKIPVLGHAGEIKYGWNLIILYKLALV